MECFMDSDRVCTESCAARQGGKECTFLRWGAKLMNLKQVQAELMDKDAEVIDKLMPMVNMMAKVFAKFEPLVTDELLDKLVEKVATTLKEEG